VYCEVKNCRLISGYENKRGGDQRIETNRVLGAVGKQGGNSKEDLK
jgi:hypothetical protein